MSTRTALNKELIMRRVADRYPGHAQPENTTPTSLLTAHSDITARFLHESDTQWSLFSDVVLARLESFSNQFRSVVRTPGAHTAALSAVDREIDASIRLTRALLTQRNALPPISVLPPEVLARIFHLVALAESPWSELQSLRWINVTHVCRHWRQVALDDSSLWARISGYRPSTAWISETLARARNAPLAIVLLRAPNMGTLAILPAHFAHTREFRLCGLLTHHFDDSVRNMCRLEAPILEHFELGVAVTASPVSFLGAPFFNGVAPKLRTFSLSQVRVPWSSIPCGQLTQLKITLFNERSVAGGPSLGGSKSLIDLLINCPVLEILALEFCLPHSITGPSHVQAIPLPRLTYLSLGGLSSRVANLLKILKLPPSTTLRLRCTSENTATHNDQHLLPLVSAHFHNPASVEIKSFRVTLNHTEHLINFAAFTYPPKFATHLSYLFGDDVDGDAALALSFDALPEVDNGVDILGRVCSMLPISNIEFLSINAPDMDRSVDWGELFRRCAKLTRIEASGRGTSGLLKELTPPKPPKKSTSGPGGNGKGKKRKPDNRGAPAPSPSSSAATADTTPMPIFPKLASLFLLKLDFDEPAHRSGVLYEVLCTTLRRREACKVPLKMLGIDRCTITTNRANALGKLVPEFIWNGNGDGDEGTSLDEFDHFDDFSDVDRDRWDPNTGGQLAEYFIGTSQTEWEWWENYSDGL